MNRSTLVYLFFCIYEWNHRRETNVHESLSFGIIMEVNSVQGLVGKIDHRNSFKASDTAMV